jgi:enterochelin esterase family protein
VLTGGLLHEKLAFSKDTLQSPCLAALAIQIKAGTSSAIGEFWHEVSQKGTPLVEPIEGDPENALVTFLYPGDKDVNNVVVFIGNGLWGDIDSNRMVRLLESDIWYKTYKFRRDARFTYSLSVNDSLISLRGMKDTVEWLERTANWQVDPMNPRRFQIYPRAVSVVELPEALPQPWNAKKPGVPKGSVTVHKVKSLILKNERTVWVYTPPDYGLEKQKYGMLILFDGPAYKDWVPTPTILDNLISEKRIPSLIAVLVSHPNPLVRNTELTCSESFTRFLGEELMLWIGQRYSVTSDPSRIVVGGSSYGGLGAAYAAFRYPEIFGNVLTQSGAFMYSPPEDSEPEWLVRQFETSLKLPIRFHIDFGLMEDFPVDGDTPTIVMTNRRFHEVLRAKGYWVHYQEFNGGHEYINWRGTLADGLIALLGNEADR